MKNEQIRDVIVGLSDDSPYLRAIRKKYFPGKEHLSTAERLVYPMSDPAFGWHFTTAYFRSRRTLPFEVDWPSIRRTFFCLMADNGFEDRASQEAISLGQAPTEQTGIA